MARRWTPMEPGERDYIITIEQVTDSVDGSSGEPLETWTTLEANMPAGKYDLQGYDLQGYERQQVNQLSARYDTRWEINYRLDMDPDLVDVPKTRRIVCRGRTHDIVAASMIGRREGIELQTIAKVG